LGDQIPTTKSEREVKNYFATLNKIFILAKRQTPISIELTSDLHKQLMEGLDDKNLGEFRDSGVFVGRRTKTEIVVKKVLGEIYEWLNRSDSLHPLIKAGIFHHQFAYIHPFFDGNGRLARILTAYFLLLRQYEVVKFFILDDYYDIDRQLYSDTLHIADIGDESPWLEYFLEGIAYSLQAAKARIANLRKSSLEELEGEKRVLVTPREEEVLQIVIDKKAVKTADIQGALDVTRQQAHSILASLVKKGLLEKFGKTKTSYYKLVSKPVHE